MATGTLAPAFWFTAIDDDGLIMPGALLSFFLSGTSTPAAVYHDADLTTAWIVPAPCDSAGRIVVYLDPSVGNLKMTMTDSLGTPVGPTVDPVTPTNAGASGLGEVFFFGSNSSAVITQTSYPSGATFDKLHPGTFVWQQNVGALTGTLVLEAMGNMEAAGTLSVALVNLVDGSPDTPIAEVTLVNLSGQIGQSAPIVFPPSGAKTFGLKTKVSANSGFLTGARIVRTA